MGRMTRSLSLLVGVATLSITALTAPTLSLAQDNAQQWSKMSIQQLLNTKVTTVSRQPEDPFKSAAAVYVITREDIRRSGATSIPELLRLVPGLQVARAGANQWAISSRGFNGAFANKLLVQIDGRTVYTPLFSGVYWGVQDTFIDDIKQIEVIRGPGATLWGANAVNGIINIITEEATNTQENQVNLIYGNEEQPYVSARHGGKVGDDLFYRGYAKYFDRADLRTLQDTPANDDWNEGRGGFRVDYNATTQDFVTVQGDVYQGDQGLDLNVPGIPSFTRSQETLDARGANLLSRWTKDLEDGSEAQLQAYLDYQRFDYSLLDQQTYTFDLDFQHAKALSENHDVVWGLGYRYIADDLAGSFLLNFNEQERERSLYSAFVQDKINLIDDTLDFTVGSKFEHNDFTGFEVQPSARLGWYPAENQTVWASVSRAVRTPSRAEDDIRLVVGTFNNQAFIRQDGLRSFDSENLIAYELGYRIRPSETTSVDATVFFNDYDNLRSLEIQPFVLENGIPFIPLTAANLGKGKTYGFEVVGKWDILPEWSVTAQYTLLQLDLDASAQSTDTELEQDQIRSPQNQFSLRSNVNLPYNLELDNYLYFVDNVAGYGVENYTRFDTRIGWKTTENIEVSLVGQNLFDDLHPEFGGFLAAPPEQVGRVFYGKLTVRF